MDDRKKMNKWKGVNEILHFTRHEKEIIDTNDGIMF